VAALIRKTEILWHLLDSLYGRLCRSGLGPGWSPGVTTISLDTRPRLAAKARLRWIARTSASCCFYPERGLVLNPTAADVVKLCTGELTVGAIAIRSWASTPRSLARRWSVSARLPHAHGRARARHRR